jgi:hypothetical protein
LTYVNKIERFYYSIESLACVENYVSFCRLSNAFVYVFDKKIGRPLWGRPGHERGLAQGAPGVLAQGLCFGFRADFARRAFAAESGWLG